MGTYFLQRLCANKLPSVQVTLDSVAWSHKVKEYKSLYVLLKSKQSVAVQHRPRPSSEPCYVLRNVDEDRCSALPSDVVQVMYIVIVLARNFLLVEGKNVAIIMYVLELSTAPPD